MIASHEDGDEIEGRPQKKKYRDSADAVLVGTHSRISLVLSRGLSAKKTSSGCTEKRQQLWHWV